MAFNADLVSVFNQTSGGASEAPTVYNVRYEGPLADWTTGVTEDLKTFLDERDAGAGDGLFLLTTEDSGATYNANVGVLQFITATTTGFAIATLTAPT